ncbi:hypothetical protein UB43_28115 [Pseudomonas sp. 21]|nr:hypothetical protein UB43_28115 [Pseudomonas sp. 21]
MLLIDELNEILNCSAREARKNLSLLKKLSGAPFSISIVALGTDECESAIAYEKQMARRFERLCLAPWYESDQLRSFLASYESTFPFRLPSGLSSESYVKYLIKESHGVLDDMVKIIINAAVWAIVTESDRITLEILKQGKIRPVY